MKTFSIKDLKNVLNEDKAKILNWSEFINFNDIKPILEANEQSITWIKSSVKSPIDLIIKTKSKLIILDVKNYDSLKHVTDKCLVFVKDPKLEIIDVINHFFIRNNYKFARSSENSENHKGFGKNVYIHPSVDLGDCTIGNGTIINSLCTVNDNTTIGNNVIIHSGSKIGTDGFGYVKLKNGSYRKFPHIGGVEIENNVEIGANTCIDRGSLGNTVIKSGVKIDNLSMIAHNVQIGSNSIICSNVSIAGSVKVKNNVWIAPSVSIMNGITIGENAFIGIGSVVINDIPDNQVWAGYPARKN